MEGSSPKAQLVRAWIVGVALLAAVFLLPGYAHAASLFISPGTRSVTVGQTFVLSADVSSPDQAMNAASGDISFPSDKLQVLSVSKANSVMNLWIRDPSFTNSQAGGDVHFEGIVLNPGFTGGGGNLITVTFEAIAPGDAPISFSSGAVLANDGNGTNILNGTQSGDVTVLSKSTVVAPPASTPQTPSANVSTLGVLAITELPNPDSTDPRPIFIWKLSGPVTQGITYTAKIGNGDPFNASTIALPQALNEYQLPVQAPTSETTLTVVATDPAGNSTSSTATFSITPIAPPTIRDFTRAVPATNQLFSVEGTAATDTTILVYLQKSDSILTYSAQTDASGQWSLAGEKAMAAGIWKLTAQAQDSRGALSSLTASQDVQVSGWFGDLFGQVVDWAIIILAIIVLLGCIVLLALYIVHQLRRWNVSANKDVIELENRLRKDLARIEKELNEKKRE